MKPIVYRQVEGNSNGFWLLLSILGAMILAGVGASFYMEHHGHYVTGMNNQIVWGMPHIFAVFLIIAASGALNVASIASVFDKKFYKPMAPLSALLSLALLTGGLIVLVLDLGRPDRLIIAMTKLNLKSIFAWNQILYNGFFVIVGVYLWFMLEKKMSKYTKIAGYAAFIWRLILTTGTGSIFGFLVARQGYDAAIMAPMFIIMSFSFGMAIFILVLMAAYKWTDRPLGDAVLGRLRNLLAVFVSAVMYFVLVYHLTNLYAAEHHGIQSFILLGNNGGEAYSKIFWIMQILIGSVVPLVIFFTPLGKNRVMLAAGAALVIIGGLAQVYVIIIGGQAFPIVIFPNMEVITSGFMDGMPASYSSSLPEFILGFGAGIGLSMILVVIGIKALRFLPENLGDDVMDPHAASKGAA
ncbi:MAG: molybdopterin oxidoreductase [Gammaproteobacteria bacterium]|nr:MAG: molybdopterin oxidoreductase [Gammaproteobacteria bacterium]